MKCSRCGYKAKDIAHLAAHYRKVHPKVMGKRKTNSRSKKCPHCGRKI